MSADRAKALGVPNPVPILGFGAGNASCDVPFRPSLTDTLADVSGATAYQMAGLGPKDIQAAQIYDCFTVTVAQTLEAYGFGGPEALTEMGNDGGFQVGGALPVNTSGGLLSETGMPGLQLVLEAVRQVRGVSTSQVEGLQKCIVSNQGGAMHTHSTMIVGH